MQDKRNSFANALELRLSCSNPSIWCIPGWIVMLNYSACINETIKRDTNQILDVGTSSTIISVVFWLIEIDIFSFWNSNQFSWFQSLSRSRILHEFHVILLNICDTAYKLACWSIDCMNMHSDISPVFFSLRQMFVAKLLQCFKWKHAAFFLRNNKGSKSRAKIKSKRKWNA